jgi:hypothetical protein
MKWKHSESAAKAVIILRKHERKCSEDFCCIEETHEKFKENFMKEEET